MPSKPDLTQVERDKLEINPDFDFREIAKRPFDDLTKNEIGMFKWSGVYHQLQTGFFMIRLRVPGGAMTADQLDRAADLCNQYAQDQLCITTRQCLQFHWIRQEDIYKIIEGMKEVGVLTHNACGDVTRNVVGCTMQGVCPHETGNSRDMMQAIADDPEILYQQRNLPRKHKISVAGCNRACGQTLMNCQGWFPVLDDETGGRGWCFYAGGGLGGLPHIGKKIFSWVPEHLVVEVAKACVEAFRRHGDRRKRRFARLKIVVEKMGHDAFADLLLDILNERGVKDIDQIIKSRDGVPDIAESYLKGQEVIPQSQQGFCTVRIIVPRSEMASEQAHRFAQWAREYGNGELLFTNRQNVQIRFVPEHNVEPLLKEIKQAGYMHGHEHLPDIVSCVGTTQCNLAVSDTPNMYWRMQKELCADESYWKQVGPVSINMNGCPNSCGQHWINDIGLRGMRLRRESGSEEGFAVYLGGSLAGEGYIAEKIAEIPTSEVVPVVRGILDLYLHHRHSEKEEFAHFLKRFGIHNIYEKLPVTADRETPSSDNTMRFSDICNKVVEQND